MLKLTSQKYPSIFFERPLKEKNEDDEGNIKAE
jgi:hypothetical protein